MEKDLFIEVMAEPTVIHFGYSGLGEGCFHFKMPLAKVVKKTQTTSSISRLQLTVLED